MSFIIFRMSSFLKLVGRIQTQEGRQGGLLGKNEMVSEFVWYTSPLVGKL